jgi:hypothetical protein
LGCLTGLAEPVPASRIQLKFRHLPKALE